jgi:hypothetical protein
MQGSEIFISSLSRRQLARRKPARQPARTHLLLALVVMAAALGVLLVVHLG